MALAKTEIIPGQCMISMLCIQWAFFQQHLQNIL